MGRLKEQKMKTKLEEIKKQLESALDGFKDACKNYGYDLANAIYSVVPCCTDYNNKTKIKNMNVLSLFDGMSCGQIALNKLGIKVDNYFSSEIDKYAMQVTKKNYPGTKQIGSIIDLTREQLLDLGEIDLLIGGSPCQGFSFAGKQKGSSTKGGIKVTSLSQYLKLKELGFEFEGQSYLFWEYVRVWKIVKPKNFLLENVRITKKWQKMFDEAMGVKPIIINSALVCAQNRVRYYWTNIEGITQPQDKQIVLRDVLEDGEKIGAIRGRYVVDGKRQDYKMKTAGLTTQRLEVRKDEKSNCLTTVQKDNVVLRPCEAREYKRGSICHHSANAIDINGNESIKRVYSDSGKSPTLTTMQGGHREPKVLINGCNGLRYRKLTPLECERLQTVPDNYTDCVSNSQRYKLLGNGWTVDVIAHIFKNIPLTDAI
jgi:DNA (cytosine-5)-methyltransferase 3A